MSELDGPSDGEGDRFRGGSLWLLGLVVVAGVGVMVLVRQNAFVRWVFYFVSFGD